MQRDVTDGGVIGRAYARLVVGVSPLIVVAWIAAAAAALVFLPPLGGSQTAPLEDIIPADAPALKAQQRAYERFGSTLGADTVIVQRNPKGLSQAELKANARAVRTVFAHRLPPLLHGLQAAVPLYDVRGPGVKWNESGTTLLTYLFASDDLNLLERDRLGHRYITQLVKPAPGTRASVTGAGPARLQQFKEIEDHLPIVSIATLLVIFVIVAAYFRSLGAPLVTMFTAGLAYVIATRVLAWSGERIGTTVPSEIEPVLVVLLLGLVTDYTIFFMSEARRRLARGERRGEAIRRTTIRIAPLVFTAGILVAGGVASLIAGRMQFFRVFGPGMAVAAIAVTVVCVTFVPAILTLLGPRLFAPDPEDLEAQRLDDEPAPIAAAPPARLKGPARERWRMRTSGLLGALRASRTEARREGGSAAALFGVRVLSSRAGAAPLALITITVLGVAAYGARDVSLSVSHIPSLPSDTEARRGGADAARGFSAGVMSPTEIVVEQPGITDQRPKLARLQSDLSRAPGVATVIGPAYAAAQELEPVVLAKDGGAARFAVFLDSEPTSAPAIDSLKALRASMPRRLAAAGLSPQARVSYGGETALSQETVQALKDDLLRVAGAIALVTFILLALFLRALVAPLLLLIGSALAFAASFGLTALILPELVGGDDIVYYVPLVGAVLLIGLGSDYNVFIAGRIREEAGRRRLREAIAVGAPSASRAITVAGLTLAATFALLALVPLRPFRELAVLMSIGVLVDAMLVRPLLIPALIAISGRATWWPGNPRKLGPASEFLQSVARRSGQTEGDAQRITAATFETLAERLPARESAELATQLPEEIAVPLRDAASDCEPFGADEFVARVAERLGENRRTAALDVTAVVAALTESLPDTELDYMRAALSEDYRPLFGQSVPQDAGAGADPVAAG